MDGKGTSSPKEGSVKTSGARKIKRENI